MNERIKELAEQAGYIEAHYESDDGPFVPAEFNKEKFAKLIVRECTSFIAKRRNQAFDDYYSVDEAVSIAIIDLLESFGIES